MLTTVHLLVGASIGKYFENIWIIIILAILSHYILDFIPHYSHQGFEEYRKKGLKAIPSKRLFLLSIEHILGIALVLYLIHLNKGKAVLMVLGVFFAWFPDLLSFISWKYLSFRYNITAFEKILPRPRNIFYNRAKSLFVGILTQVIVLIVAILGLLLKF